MVCSYITSVVYTTTLSSPVCRRIRLLTLARILILPWTQLKTGLGALDVIRLKVSKYYPVLEHGVIGLLIPYEFAPDEDDDEDVDPFEDYIPDVSNPFPSKSNKAAPSPRKMISSCR